MSKILELLPPNLSPPASEADALLEIAFLVSAVDGHLADVELAAFTSLAGKLNGAAKVDDLIDRFAGNVDPEEIEARVRELAPTIPKDHRELAYKLALGIALVDYDPSEEEDEIQVVLAEALGLSKSQREALAREVSLGGGKA